MRRTAVRWRRERGHSAYQGWGSLVPALLAIALVASAQAHEEQSAPPSGIGIEQRLNAQLPLDLMFRDEAGRPVRLGDYFGEKPAILALVYHACAQLCPLRLEGLVASLRALPLNAGEHFTVLVVSFDPQDTPALAAAKKVEYLWQDGRPGAAEGWYFLTGDAPAIDQLTHAVGFRYTDDARQGQYVHASGITVLTPQGKIARYFYGLEYSPRDLRLALVEASAGTIGSLVDQVLLLCYRYDPSTGRYSAFVLNLVRLGGALTLLALGTFMGVTWRRDLRRKRATMGGG